MRRGQLYKSQSQRGFAGAPKPIRNSARIVHVCPHEAQKAADLRLQTNGNFSAASIRFRLRYFLPVLAVLLWTAWTYPDASWTILHHVLYVLFALGTGLRLCLLLIASRPRPHEPVPNWPDDPRILPVVTILLPLYDEAGVLPELAEAVDALHWPDHQLDVKLLLEADDTKTLQCAESLGLGPHWEILVLPDVGPRTKPKALNVGLARARGAFVTIFDAEDRPHPMQLLAAIQAFAKGGERLVCVQAPLHVHNAGENWLTAQFAAEYDAHFRVLLPAMQWLGLSFPLGGTSNYFRRDALLSAGGWDAHNVTEDADLGLVLSRMGGRLGCIQPPTEEEATRTLHAWTGQRSRWIKGFLQTFIVHARNHAGHGYRTLAGMCLFLGMSLLSAFLHLPLLLFCIVVLLQGVAGGSPPPTPDLLLGLVGMGSAFVLLVMGCWRSGRSVSWMVLWLASLYWPLQTWAAIRAFVELFTRPFHWQKTDHGHDEPAKRKV